jgi:hypothetical protein
MNLLILHLSDIHLKKENNFVAPKLDGLRGVIEAHAANVDACMIAISGDVAYSGKKGEYAIAAQLFDHVRSACTQCALTGYLCCIPGNHDCDFEQADRTRELVIAGVLSDNGKNIDESIVAACSKVQDNFFDFLHRQTGFTSKSPIHRLAYAQDFDHDGVKIRINCINTAWISQRHERQSELLFPVQYLEPTPGGFQLVVTMFHHPYGWLPSPNAQALRKHAEENSDVILTGHEHEGNAFSKEAFNGEKTTYLEGGVLQDTQYKNVSTFNLLLIDLDQRRLKVEQYKWSGDLYTQYFQSSWKPFLRGTLFLRNAFPISSRFLGELNDPGAQFSHPGADRISLTDLFVAPDFREFLPPKIKRRAARDLVPGTQVLKEISLEAHHLITGAEKSGKTALAKHIYLEAHARGMVPLFLNGREIRKTNIDRVEQYIEKAFGDQYDPTLFERFTQLPKAKKILVLDDFQTIELGTDSKIRFYEYCAHDLEDLSYLVTTWFEYKSSQANGARRCLRISSSIKFYSLDSFCAKN